MARKVFLPPKNASKREKLMFAGSIACGVAAPALWEFTAFHGVAFGVSQVAWVFMGFTYFKRVPAE